MGRGQALIEEVLEREETQFRKTLEKGLKLLDEATGDMAEGGELDGETAFKLYDTYGFPYDLTEDALRARGIGVDREGFDAAMERQKAAARAAWKGSGEAASDEVWFDIADREGATEFTGYTSTDGEGVVLALVSDGSVMRWSSSPTRRRSMARAADRKATRAGSGPPMASRSMYPIPRSRSAGSMSTTARW